MSATRRQFLQTAAAGGAALLVEVPLFGKGEAARLAPNPWLSIGADGQVTLVVGHSEMGQGVRTSLAMILAEELEADWSAVKIAQASPGPGYENLSTGGSDSVEDSWKPLRTAGATAREMLIAAAARTLEGPGGRVRRPRRRRDPCRDRAPPGVREARRRWRPRSRCRRSRVSRTARTSASSARP